MSMLKDSLASVIKYEGDNQTFVWKHPTEDFNYGSQLIVHESQEAIFFKNGQALDAFGAGRYTLETQKLPLMEKIYGMLTDAESTFHSEVYYINLATQMGIKWGTDTKVNLLEPVTGIPIEIGASGEFNIRVINSRKLLLKIVGTTSGMNQAQFLGDNQQKGFFRSMIITHVKSHLAQVVKDLNINILEIDSHLLSLSQGLQTKINEALSSYGLEIPEFFIKTIVMPTDKNFDRLKQLYAEQYLAIRTEEIRKQEALAAAERKAVEAETRARMKIIEAQGEAEAYRLQAEAEAKEMKMKGYTYAQETSREVGLAAMQNGLTGGEGGGGAVGGLGDIAGLGVALGAMGGVIGMTKDAMNPIIDTSAQMGQSLMSDTWKCSCGSDVSGNFCSNCGSKKETVETWTCDCGETGITGNFCSNCGNKKQSKSTFDCACGEKNITGNFCTNCGAKKGE